MPPVFTGRASDCHHALIPLFVGGARTRPRRGTLFELRCALGWATG